MSNEEWRKVEPIEEDRSPLGSFVPFWKRCDGQPDRDATLRVDLEGISIVRAVVDLVEQMGRSAMTSPKGIVSLSSLSIFISPSCHTNLPSLLPLLCGHAAG